MRALGLVFLVVIVFRSNLYFCAESFGRCCRYSFACHKLFVADIIEFAFTFTFCSSVCSPCILLLSAVSSRAFLSCRRVSFAQNIL